MSKSRAPALLSKLVREIRIRPLPRRVWRYFSGAFACFLIFNILFRPLRRINVRIQHDFPKRPLAQIDRRQFVKREFLHAWNGYEDHGWMADGLRPISGYIDTKFCSWSATLVDALDTLWIMGLKEEFDEAVNATLTVDFRHTAASCDVNLFESTIRYLGGMIGAYELSGDARLLPKLTELGDMLIRAFNTTNGMPCSHCHLASELPSEHFEPVNDAALANVGSLTLEFSRLSQITGDEKYIHTVEWLSSVFQQAQNESSLPGMWPERLDATSIDPKTTGGFVHKSFAYSLGALSDSAYEYLVKGHALMGGVTPVYRDMWDFASQQIRSYLLFRAMVPNATEPEVLFAGIASRFEGSDDVMLEPRTEHLACFAGGLFGIASKIFNEPDDLEIGKQLTQGCVWAYQHSPIGIMPETFSMVACPNLDGFQCEYNQTEFDMDAQRPPCEPIPGNDCPTNNLPPGWLASLDAKYNLRPEALESVFVMWRITGDNHWREVGWEMFQSIIKHTRTPYGHSSLMSVLFTTEQEVVEQGRKVMRQRAVKSDEMESFWFAETLKYAYLLFSEPDLISLDEYVLNTEAHPMKLLDGSRGF